MDEKELFKYNDYELIYLATEDFDKAFEILAEKYTFLIYSRLKKYNVPKAYWDDYYQEGLIALFGAIKTFDTTYSTSFTTYFDIIWTRRVITLLKKDLRNYNLESLDENQIDLILEENNINLYLSDIKEMDFDFSSLELKVYELTYVNNLKNSDIAILLNVSTRTVSNAKQRIIKKMRQKLKIK